MWAVLGLAMVVPRANRTREMLWILVPVLLVNLIWLVLARISHPVTSDEETMGMMVQSSAVASAVLWLLGHTLARLRPWKATILASGLTWGVALVGTLSTLGLSRPAVEFGSMLGLSMLVLVLGYAWAGRMSRRAYSPTRFILLLAGGMVAFFTAGVPLWFLLESAGTAHWPAHIFLTVGVLLLSGSAAGLCVFLISLPFVLVGLHSPLFRPRLFACLRLPAAPNPSGTPTAMP